MDALAPKKKMFGALKAHAKSMGKADLKSRYGSPPPSDEEADSKPVPGAEDDGSAPAEGSPEEEATETPMEAASEGDSGAPPPDGVTDGDVAGQSLDDIDPMLLKKVLMALLASAGG